ncbi:MAG: DAK2 domain-containing protein [Trueperaceae bacterium]|nr:DAK2 domain-containing protein [Trueperaceae bacterium]
MPEASSGATPATLGPQDLAGAFTFATDFIGVHIAEINALNVYPVPDGDTGTNMHLTLQSVRRQLQDEAPETMADFCHALSYGSLLGARGNSGVILSQVLKGFADVAKGHDALDASTLAAAFSGASKSAYAAVMKPVEGTILTVVRESAATAANGAEGDEVPLDLLRRLLEAGHASLERTPDLLPILKQAGVVDAGGLGYLRMIEGVVAFLEGRELPPPPTVTRRAQEDFEEEAFGFCTEFLLSNVTVDTREIQEAVAPFGDSLLVVGAEGFVKGHIHTEEPEKLLALVGRYGTMVRSKVEDMSEQHSEILSDVEMGEAAPPRTGLVVVSSGYGPTKVFRSLGARVVGGGQTDNPSVQDIADAVRSLGATTVVVMPNNKNIIMAAERVSELLPDKDVRVLPTRTLGQGLAAAVLFDEEKEVEELMDAMEATAATAKTFEVTVASRAATIDGVSVKEGDYIGLLDDTLVATAEDPDACLLEMIEAHGDEGEIATLFYNASVGPEAARALITRLEEAFPDIEFELHAGGPDLYPYLFVLE